MLPVSLLTITQVAVPTPAPGIQLQARPEAVRLGRKWDKIWMKDGEEGEGGEGELFVDMENWILK